MMIPPNFFPSFTIATIVAVSDADPRKIGDRIAITRLGTAWPAEVQVPSRQTPNRGCVDLFAFQFLSQFGRQLDLSYDDLTRQWSPEPRS